MVRKYINTKTIAKIGVGDRIAPDITRNIETKYQNLFHSYHRTATGLYAHIQYTQYHKLVRIWIKFNIEHSSITAAKQYNKGLTYIKRICSSLNF